MSERLGCFFKGGGGSSWSILASMGETEGRKDIVLINSGGDTKGYPTFGTVFVQHTNNGRRK